MHISEGVLSPLVLGAGAVLSAAGLVIGLRRISYERLMLTAILSAVFFVASLIHVPLGPGSVHLVLNGLIGLILGWAAFPAIAVALLLQAVLFQYGGLTTLGVNTFTMSMPAIICCYIFKPLISVKGWRQWLGGALCGALSIAGATLFTALALAFSNEGFIGAAKILFLAHIPVMIIEAVICAFALSFLLKVRPDLLLFRASSPQAVTLPTK